MAVYRNLLKFSGCNPYHDDYNPDALDNIDLKTMKPYESVDVILSLKPSIIRDAQYELQSVNDYYREHSETDEDYGGLSQFLSDFINQGEGILEDIKEQWIEEIDLQLETSKGDE